MRMYRGMCEKAVHQPKMMLPGVDQVVDETYPASKRMRNLLRHHPELREPDDAVA